jgi:hypothetical protein
LSFSQGAFAGIQRLILHETGLESLAAFCLALEGSPCVKKLTLLDLEAFYVSSPEMDALGGLFEKSLLLSFQELNLGNNPNITDSGLVHLANGIKVAGVHAVPALKKLLLSETGIGSTGFKALMSAIEMACFPALEELDLSSNALLDTDYDCLSQTIRAGHLSNLRILDLGGTGVKSSKVAGALTAAILMHCPKMTTLEDNVRQTIQGVLQERKDLDIAFR